MSRLLPDLKQQILRDNTAAFTAPGGFSEKMEIVYQEKSRRVWAQMEEEGTAVRDKNNNQRKNDNEKTLYQYDKYLWITQRDLGFVPKALRKIRVNGIEYKIREVNVEFGMVELVLRRLME